MQYAHQRGIVHRDLKPANVLLAVDGTPKITDFGLAKQLESDSGQTQAGQVLGTPSYMAPEQAYGDSEKITPAADIYALGGILYDLLTGRPPFSGTSVIETLEMVRTREPVPPSQLAGKIPRDLETITLKCLQKEPSRRYASAKALADDLRRFLDGWPILARPVSPLEKAWRWAKRNPWVAGLGTSVAFLLVAVAVVTSALSYGLAIKKKQAEEAAKSEAIAKDNEKTQRIAAEIARDHEAAAHKTEREQRELSLATIRGVLIDVDNEMRNDVHLAPIRRRIVEQDAQGPGQDPRPRSEEPARGSHRSDCLRPHWRHLQQGRPNQGRGRLARKGLSPSRGQCPRSPHGPGGVVQPFRNQESNCGCGMAARQ